MKRIYLIALPLFALLGAAGCSDTDKSCGDTEGEVYEITRVEASLGGIESSAGVASRAGGFAVNTGDDPTYDMSAKYGWQLQLEIYRQDGTLYPEGSGVFTWDGSKYWVTSSSVFMPNYLIQNVKAELAPSVPWTGPIAADQSRLTDFIDQDVLVQDREPTYPTTPAHYLEVRMRHAHSMIDFILTDVDPLDIASVTVVADGVTYVPYKVPVSGREEYMVILPLGVEDPTIRVETNAGARYTKELKTGPTTINTCYYIRLAGLELRLEAITVSNWTYGKAVEGDYSTVTSYPTFRGPANTALTLYYDNGLEQTITFNDRGEVTAKPLGRTIVSIGNDTGSYTYPTPLAIRNMILDLNDAIALIVP